MTPEQTELASQLNQMQIDTVLGVVAGKTQRQAYIDAGGKGSTEKSIDAAASKLLSLDKVRAFYDSLVSSAAGDAVLTRAEALERLSLIARTRITDVLEFETVEVETTNKDGEPETKTETIWRMKESAELNELAASAIKSVTMTKFGPKIEMHDAPAAIAQVAKMQGWDAPQKVDHTSTDGSMSPKPVVVVSEMTDEQLAKLVAEG